jgi:hypothetical protein
MSQPSTTSVPQPSTTQNTPVPQPVYVGSIQQSNDWGNYQRGMNGGQNK